MQDMESWSFALNTTFTITCKHGIEEVYVKKISNMTGIMHGVWAENEFSRIYQLK